MSGPGVDALLAQMRAQRDQWVELEPGVRVKVRRPHEFAVARLRGGVEIEHLVEHVVDWEGVTGETLLGQGVGDTGLVPFNPQLWREAVSDRGAWALAVSDAILSAIKAHFDRKAAAAKN